MNIISSICGLILELGVVDVRFYSVIYILCVKDSPSNKVCTTFLRFVYEDLKHK